MDFLDFKGRTGFAEIHIDDSFGFFVDNKQGIYNGISVNESYGDKNEA